MGLEGNGDEHVKEVEGKGEDTGGLVHSSRVDSNETLCEGGRPSALAFKYQKRETGETHHFRWRSS